MRFFALLMLLLGCQAVASACNPDPPRHPVMRGYPYDEIAATRLRQDAESVVAARLELRLDVELPATGDTPEPIDTRTPSETAGETPAETPGEGAVSASYVFEALEGWQAPVPRRITLAGYWVPCDIQPEAGRVFLLYLDGERLLHAVPVEALDFELQMLGEPDWFYDARGRFVQDTGQ